MRYLKKTLCAALAATMILMGTSCNVLLEPESPETVTEKTPIGNASSDSKPAETEPVEATPSETEKAEETMEVTTKAETETEAVTEEETTEEETTAHVHVEELLYAVAPTCTETGLTEGKKCAECEEVLVVQEVIPAAGHTPGADATCTEPQNCTVCGEILNSANGHIPGAPATCTTAQTCTVCHIELAPAKGHTEKSLPGVEPTCTATGLTEGKKCADCDEVLVPQTVIDLLGHSYTSTFIDPTATEDGYTEYTCSRCGDVYTETVVPVSFTVTSNNWSQIGYTGEEGETLVIPAVFQKNGTWYRVTSIGDSAFNNCSALTSIVVPDSVTSIGFGAFYGCTGLTDITIGNGLMSVGEAAFCDCVNLTSIVVMEGNSIYHSDGNCLIETESKTLVLGCQTSSIPTDGSVTHIGNYAFGGCVDLTYISIPGGVLSIGSSAFSACTGLSSIEIPDSVTSIGNHAFYSCDSLTSVTLGNSVQSIGETAFYHCNNLTSIVIPDSVTSIGSTAFSYCENLTSVTIGNGVTSIGESAFAYCKNLSSIDIPGSVKSIGVGAFSGCSRMTSATLGNNVSNIDRWTFKNCYGLTTVVIPNSVTSIEDYSSFFDCSNLTDIYFTGTEAEWEAIVKGDRWDYHLPAYTLHFNYVP